MTSIAELQHHALFADIDWNHVRDQEPPFVPDPDDACDTTYFQGKTAWFSHHDSSEH